MNILSIVLALTQSLCNPALLVARHFAEGSEEDRGSDNFFEIGVIGGNSRYLHATRQRHH